MTGYTRDLAHIHDVGFGGFVERAAPWLLRAIAASGHRAGTVVDLGCGSGSWAERLVREGYDVLGVDISPSMIALARRRAPRGRFVLGSFLRCRLPRCAAITALGEVLGYLFDGRNDARRLARFFARAHAALRPGGLLVFDVLEPRRGGWNVDRHAEGDDWVVVSRVRQTPGSDRFSREISSFRRVGALYRRTDEVHEVRLFDRDVVRRELERVGFRPKLVRGYGRLRFRRGHIGFVARNE